MYTKVTSTQEWVSEMKLLPISILLSDGYCKRNESKISYLLLLLSPSMKHIQEQKFLFFILSVPLQMAVMSDYHAVNIIFYYFKGGKARKIKEENFTWLFNEKLIWFLYCFVPSSFYVSAYCCMLGFFLILKFYSFFWIYFCWKKFVHMHYWGLNKSFVVLWSQGCVHQFYEDLYILYCIKGAAK